MESNKEAKIIQTTFETVYMCHCICCQTTRQSFKNESSSDFAKRLIKKEGWQYGTLKLLGTSQGIESIFCSDCIGKNRKNWKRYM